MASSFLDERTGEMGGLIRDFPWSKTSVDAIDKWPLTLRSYIRMILTSRFPMLVFWNKDLVTFYNDAFKPSLGDEKGKHPSSLGQKGEESWKESWGSIGPMINDIMGGGESVFFEDHKLPIYRNGELGHAHWTYSFSPLTDDSGAVNGVLVTCLETTEAVKRLESLQK